MHTGRSVFVYRNGEGLDAPVPAIVTHQYPDVEGLVDVEAFYRKASQMSHAVPHERVALVTSLEAAREAFGKGTKLVAFPYDPAKPVGLIEPPAVVKPKK